MTTLLYLIVFLIKPNLVITFTLLKPPSEHHNLDFNVENWLIFGLNV